MNQEELQRQATLILAKIQDKHFRKWDITVEVVPELTDPKNKGHVSDITYDATFRIARIEVAMDWQQRCANKHLNEVVAHELGHICSSTLDYLPPDTLKELENADEELASRFGVLLQGRGFDP